VSATPSFSPELAGGSGVLVEACVDSVESGLAAEAGGAARIELCDNLYEGGTTPSAGMMARVCDRVKIPVQVLIRPRGGDFLYDEDEINVMLGDMAFAKAVGAHGVVLGALFPDGTVDDRCTRLLLEAARPMSVTFHRAFDLVRDPFEALDTLMALGIDRVLTSGGAPTAVEGVETLAALAWRAEGRASILAGGGITEQNVARIIAEAGVHEVHIRAVKRRDSHMHFRSESVVLGKAYAPDEYARAVTTKELIEVMVATCVQAAGLAGPVLGDHA
jgi:copper homeostasis protein